MPPLILALVLGVTGSGTAVLAAGGVQQAPAPPATAAKPPVAALSPAASPPSAPSAAPTQPPPAEPSLAEIVGAAPAPRPVAPLTRQVEADLLVTMPVTFTPAQVGELRDLDDLVDLLLLDSGQVTLSGADGPVRALGVDPSSFRGWTPPPTAASDELWRAVSVGELTADLDTLPSVRPTLGGSVLVGSAQTPVRLGGLASYRMGAVGVVVGNARSIELGLAPGSAALISTPARSTASLQRAMTRIFGDAAAVTVLRSSPDPAMARKGKVQSYRDLYIQAAATCQGLSWGVLAAIGQVESDHGRNAGVSSAGAMGPMQFLPSTFAAYGVDGDDDGIADIANPYDAVFSAARLLCASGAGKGGQQLYNAIFAYNHADWYVKKVLGLAEQYSGDPVG